MAEYTHKIDHDETERIRRFLVVLAIGTVVFAGLMITAIITLPQWVRIISHESERRFIEPHVGWVSEHILDEAEPVLQDYVSTLGHKLAGEMDLPPGLELQFMVVEGSMVNAFTTLGGYIYVVNGLLLELDNENSLAMVLAHEIAHAVNRDPLTATGRGILLQVMISSLSGGGNIDPSSTTEFGSEVMLNVYSREQEEAADRLAVTALQKTYGHVGGASRLFEILQEQYADTELPDFLSSHPAVESRISIIEQLSKQSNWDQQSVTLYPADVEKALTRL
jgi:predicted Zn-dependent protease